MIIKPVVGTDDDNERRVDDEREDATDTREVCMESELRNCRRDFGPYIRFLVWSLLSLT